LQADSIEKLWDELAEEKASSPGAETVVRRLYPESEVDLFIGYDRRSKCMMLLMALSSEVNSDTISRIRTRGIDVTIQVYKDLSLTTKFLSVILLLPQFRRMFSVMVSEVVNEIIKLDSESHRIEAIINEIQKWQKLLEKLTPEGLSIESQRGLFGELCFLRDYSLKNVNPKLAVKTWTGPSGSFQDFQYINCSVEVKSTTSKRHEVLHISGEKQLDESLTPSLYLAHVRLNESPTAGETLPEIIDNIREVLKYNPLAVTEFDSKLLDIGYHDSQSGLYATKKYQVVGVTFFGVGGEFPRILDSELRNGVGDVEYSISASSCASYQIKKVELIEKLKGCNDAT